MGLDLGVELFQVSHVIVVQIDVHKAVQGTISREHLTRKPRVRHFKSTQHVSDRRAFDQYRRAALHGGPQQGGQTDFDRHNASGMNSTTVKW